MEQKILDKIELLSDKKFKIIVSNHIVNFDNGNIDVKVWSNSKQKDLHLTLDELDNRFYSNIFEDYLDSYISKLEDIEKIGISTDDFIAFKYKKNGNEIEFYDNKYYNVSTALNSMIDVIKFSENGDKSRIVDYEKEFKKHCLTKKFDVYDFYMLVREEKSLFVKNIFAFKDEFNKRYDKGIDITSFEKENNVTILVNKTKLSILLNDTDIIKNYPHKGITEEFLSKSIESFKETINKDTKLQQYLKFFDENDIKLPRGVYIAKSYGVGVPHFYNPTFKKDVNEILEVLKDSGINMKKVSQEFSDAEWIYRVKIKPQDLSPSTENTNKVNLNGR